MRVNRMKVNKEMTMNSKSYFTFTEKNPKIIVEYIDPSFFVFDYAIIEWHYISFSFMCTT